MSDHGAGASPGPEDGVPWIRLVLEEMGLATPLVERDTVRRTSKAMTAALYRALNPRLPRSVRALIRRWVPAARSATRAAIRYQYDWSRSRAFCMGASGDVWLNVRGREPEGMTEPGADYEHTREHIKETFMALRDAASGEPIIEAVFFREDVYHGPFVERAPDLHIRFRDTVVNGIRMGDRVLRLPHRGAASPKDVKTGSHRPDGLFVLSGTGVRSRFEVEGAQLADVTPTVMYLLGRPVPAHMDGRVLTDAFAPEHLAANPPSSVTLDVGSSSGDESTYTREEAALVMERLRDLGYV
jgi:hypothetical protein